MKTIDIENIKNNVLDFDKTKESKEFHKGWEFDKLENPSDVDEDDLYEHDIEHGILTGSIGDDDVKIDFDMTSVLNKGELKGRMFVVTEVKVGDEIVEDFELEHKFRILDYVIEYKNRMIV